MATSLAPMKCPLCGATVDAPVTLDYCFCTYCGSKIPINNEDVVSTNINKTTRLADDAKAAAAGYNKYVLVGVGAIVGVTALLFLFGLVTGNESAFLAAMILLVFVIGLVVLAPEYVDKERESGPKRE